MILAILAAICAIYWGLMGAMRLLAAYYRMVDRRDRPGLTKVSGNVVVRASVSGVQDMISGEVKPIPSRAAVLASKPSDPRMN